MATRSTHPIYEALPLPNEAIANGGVEILRAGIIDDELYVNARRALRNASQWGEILAEIARRLALLYSAEDTDLSEKEILTDIEEAFAAAMGAPIIKDRPARRGVRKPHGPVKKSKRAKPRKSAKRAKRAKR